MNRTSVFPVILCGGSGTRLWPFSRNSFPKQFLNIDGETSLLQETVIRTVAVSQSAPENIILLTLANFLPDVEKQLKDINYLSNHIIAEPDARNTAAAVAYAALYIKETYGDQALMWVLPSDHTIAHHHQLEKAFEKAVEAAGLGYLVTFGIKPTRPETGYGYINIDDQQITEGIFKVRAFVEKPDLNLARHYLQQSHFLWNSGMFLFRADTILNEMEIHSPSLLNAVKKSFNSCIDKKNPLMSDYQSIPSTSIDIAVMEKSTKVAVVPCDLGWSDVGSWESIWEVSDKDEHGNVTKGDVFTHQTENSLLFSLANRSIVSCSLDKMVVIDAGDVVLVAKIDSAQEMKVLLEELKSRGLGHLLDKVG